jgi:hypothetical protein
MVSNIHNISQNANAFEQALLAESKRHGRDSQHRFIRTTGSAIPLPSGTQAHPRSVRHRLHAPAEVGKDRASWRNGGVGAGFGQGGLIPAGTNKNSYNDYPIN